MQYPYIEVCHRTNALTFMTRHGSERLSYVRYVIGNGILDRFTPLIESDASAVKGFDQRTWTIKAGLESYQNGWETDVAEPVAVRGLETHLREACQTINGLGLGPEIHSRIYGTRTVHTLQIWTDGVRGSTSRQIGPEILQWTVMDFEAVVTEMVLQQMRRFYLIPLDGIGRYGFDGDQLWIYHPKFRKPYPEQMTLDREPGQIVADRESFLSCLESIEGTLFSCQCLA
jgi:hypothetical protein